MMSDQRNTGPSADTESATDRRAFLGGVITAGATALAAAAAGAAQPATPSPPAGPPSGSPPQGGRPPGGGPPQNDMQQRMAPPSRGPQLFRVEQDIAFCEVDGKVPTDLAGAFYRTGPDAQFPLRQGNIPSTAKAT
jgi:hypothetical protein